MLSIHTNFSYNILVKVLFLSQLSHVCTTGHTASLLAPYQWDLQIELLLSLYPLLNVFFISIFWSAPSSPFLPTPPPFMYSFSLVTPLYITPPFPLCTAPSLLGVVFHLNSMFWLVMLTSDQEKQWSWVPHSCQLLHLSQVPHSGQMLHFSCDLHFS